MSEMRSSPGLKPPAPPCWRSESTLLALRIQWTDLGMRSSWPDPLRDYWLEYNRQPSRVMARPPVPAPAAIDDMDAAFALIQLIPPDKIVLRRIVQARLLLDPRTDRLLYSWRRIGRLVGADYRAVQQWHSQGIALICTGLARGCGSTHRSAAARPAVARPARPATAMATG